MIEYSQIKKLSAEYLKSRIDEFLAEDKADNDKTTLGIFDACSEITAIIESEADMVFAGRDVIQAVFEGKAEIEIFAADGESLKAHTKIAEIKGNASLILSRERVLLNLIQRLSGIATLTRRYSEIAEPYGVKILDTRKTMPGLRHLDKFAVTAGGGYNHRLDLETGVLIKDNHISAAGGVIEAVSMIKEKRYNIPIELEVDNLEQINEGLKAGVDGFLLDNMSPQQTIEAVKLIRKQPEGENIFIESSGGITLATLAKYVMTGVDAVSIGALTHSVPAADIHMEFIHKA